MNRTKIRLETAGVALLALLAVARAGRADDGAETSTDQAPLVRIVLDESAKLPARETALEQVTVLAWTSEEPRKGPLKDALPSLLRKLVPKVNDPSYARLTELAFAAFEPFAPVSEMGVMARPFIAKGPPAVQQPAINAVAKHGGNRVAAELLAVLEKVAQGDRSREHLERPVVEAAAATPSAEALPVLSFALAKSRTRAVRRRAARCLGELGDPAAAECLKKASDASEPDAYVACAAAAALVRCGSLEGIGELVKRLEGIGANVEVYRTICEAAFRPTKGFADLPSERYNSSDEKTRASVRAAVRGWWDGVRAKTSEQLAFAEIAARGIAVPADVSSKEAVAALIEALDLDVRALRYAALDLLVRKTGRRDLAADFKTVVTTAGAGLSISEEEPPEGFQEEQKAAQLRTAQRARVEKWRAWWKDAAPRAVLVRGVWTLP